MALYALGLGTLFFAVGAFAVSLPKAGAWMVGMKWLGGVALAYLALAYVRDALPTDAHRRFANPRALSGAVGAILLALGLLLAGVHGAAEGRRSAVWRLGNPAKPPPEVPAPRCACPALTGGQSQ